MASKNIERFTAGKHGVLWGYGLGEYVRYPDHERIVKELKAALLERAITAHNARRHSDAWADCKMAVCVDVRALLRKVDNE